MAVNKDVLWLHIEDIPPVPTSHRVGEKRVLATMENVGSKVNQIARTVLKAGEKVQSHLHSTMDEHFLILDGECLVVICDDYYLCRGGDYLFVPAMHKHEVIVKQDTIMITIGISNDE